jgi:hypothetical protein
MDPTIRTSEVLSLRFETTVYNEFCTIISPNSLRCGSVIATEVIPHEEFDGMVRSESK